MRTLEELRPDDRDAGGKAAGLARVRAAGLAVPPGFLIDASAYRRGEVPEAELARALEGGGPFIVRSSATVEDAAPGVFVSVRDVAAADVPAAVAEVWRSLSGPTAAAYLGARRIADAAMAVIVQRQIDGVRGTAWSRRGEVLIEIGAEDPERLLVTADGAVHGPATRLPAGAPADIAAAARTLERTLGGPADVEWVLGARLWIVQARRLAEVARPEIPAEALAFSRAEPEVVWTWDAEHNPAPLSPAQAGLVELVEDAGAATVRQRVVLGYLYTTRAGAPQPARLVPADDLARVFERELRPAFEEDLGRMGEDLEETLTAYLSFYRRYALELAPSLARARWARVDVPPLALGDLAPAWDVAAPTYAEAPPGGAAGSWPAGLREVDDLYFARAQTGVRRALLALAARWGLAAHDLLFLPLSDVRAAAVRGTPPADAAARAARARAELEAQAASTPPLQICDGHALFGAPPSAGPTLRGQGGGGQARGRVLKLDAHLPRAGGAAPAPSRGRILVAATLIPTMAPLLVGARGAVAEHGGLLGHGVALARELGIPCVVGCRGALAALSDGDEVWLDADAGVVVRLQP